MDRSSSSLLKPLPLQDRQTEHIYECVSESKVSAWNGRFSLNDEVWGKVSAFNKMKLYQQMQANRSFLIGETDIAKHFE
jgi:hypothetical protein